MASKKRLDTAKSITMEKSKEFRNLPLKRLVAYSVIINIIIIGFVFIFNNRLPPQVPLFFGLPRGENQLTQSIGLAIPSFMSLGIISLNFLLASFLKNAYLQKVLIIAGVTTVVFALITVVKISILVGNF